METFRRYCNRCESDQIQLRPTPDHPLHLALTILSLGLWGISWLAVIIYSRCYGWECKGCAEKGRRQEHSPIIAARSGRIPTA